MKIVSNGFTLIELLVVIAIIGILTSLVFAAAKNGRDKADDARVRNDVRQMRWLAEIVYNGQNGSFLNWSSDASIQTSLNILTSDIQEVGIAGENIIIRDSEVQQYCVSAPFKSNPNKYYCADASVEFKISSGPCPEEAPFICP
ncbi:MAG: prepilin-type N-terminal cleavage/methylation domain-containing protein [bacterium]